MLQSIIQWIRADDILILVKHHKMHPQEAAIIIQNRAILQFIVAGLIFIAISEIILLNT